MADYRRTTNTTTLDAVPEPMLGALRATSSRRATSSWCVHGEHRGTSG